MSQQPLIIGHRGASAVAPENTLTAFRKAMEVGADGVEFDVRLSRDHVPVVIHDRTLDRTGQIKGLVADLSAAELERINVGSWFRRKQLSEDRGFEKETLPTLQQTLDIFKRDGVLYLEMKSEGEGVLLVQEVVHAIRQNDVLSRVVVSSFDLPLIAQAKSIDLRIRTAALFQPKASRPVSILRKLRLIELAKAAGADEISLHHTLAGTRTVAAALQSNLDVVVWTVDSPKWIERARSLGVKALITNDPALMLRFR